MVGIRDSAQHCTRWIFWPSKFAQIISQHDRRPTWKEQPNFSFVTVQKHHPCFIRVQKPQLSAISNISFLIFFRNERLCTIYMEYAHQKYSKIILKSMNRAWLGMLAESVRFVLFRLLVRYFPLTTNLSYLSLHGIFYFTTNQPARFVRDSDSKYWISISKLSQFFKPKCKMF